MTSLAKKLTELFQSTPWLRLWLLLASGFLFLLIFTKYAMILFFLLLTFLTALAHKFLPIRTIGIESMTLSVFVILYNYGFWTALFFLEISILIFMIITLTVTPNLLLCFPLSALLLLFMLPFKPLGIVATGMIFTIALNIVLTIVVILFGTGKLYKRLTFFATHVLINWFILKNIAPQLIAG